MNVPMVAIPQAPHLHEFERVVDYAAQSKAVVRQAFVERFFDFMLGQRMNCKADGLVQQVMRETVESFADVYTGAINIPVDHAWGADLWFGYASDTFEHGNKLPANTKTMIANELARRLLYLQMNNRKLMLNELFVVEGDEEPHFVINRWIDHTKLLSDIGEGLPYILIIRTMTILSRSYELLVAYVGVNDWE